MTIEHTLSMTGDQHRQLKSLLYSDPDREAVAILICGRRNGDLRQRLVVRDVEPIEDHHYLNRSQGSVCWSTDALAELLEDAEANNFSILKVHSHPSGYASFSSTDDRSDHILLPLLRDVMDIDAPHGSAIMLPDGKMFGRVLPVSGSLADLGLITVVGDDFLVWPRHVVDGDERINASHRQAFGAGTTGLLRHLTIAVVGCSGTGSPVIEQLVRLGVGRIILIDPKATDFRNLNRILQVSVKHAKNKTPKVDAIAERINETGLSTEVVVCNDDLASPEAADLVAQADIVIGCMDSIEGRYLLNRLSTFYVQPYIDLGVRLVADGQGGIDEICGSVHYLKPGASSLLDRGLFDMSDVAADGLRRRDPIAYQQQVSDGYIRNAVVDRPAVVSVNMFIASQGVNELLARLHPYRELPNREYATVEFSLSSMEFYYDAEISYSGFFAPHLGLGDCEPRLGLMEMVRAA